MSITKELDFIYIYKGKRFLTEEEAIKFKELIEKWIDREESKLTKKV